MGGDGNDSDDRDCRVDATIAALQELEWAAGKVELMMARAILESASRYLLHDLRQYLTGDR